MVTYMLDVLTLMPFIVKRYISKYVLSFVYQVYQATILHIYVCIKSCASLRKLIEKELVMFYLIFCTIFQEQFEFCFDVVQCYILQNPDYENAMALYVK